MKNILVSVACLFLSILANAQSFHKLSSPNGEVAIEIAAGEELKWAVKFKNTHVIIPSSIYMKIGENEALGKNMGEVREEFTSKNSSFKTPFYKKAEVVDHYNQLTLHTSKNYDVIFRAYNDGVAYRFKTSFVDSLTVYEERADFNFDNDHKVFMPYVRDFRGESLWDQAFEATYDEHKISQTKRDTMAFLPILVELSDGKEAVVTEADQQDYPGMYLTKNRDNATGLTSTHAPLVLKTFQGGIGQMNSLAEKRANYIAKTKGSRLFPWRTIILSQDDKELLNNDMVLKLAEPSRIEDPSWIKPGKISWDWWNDWQLAGVDFEAGINTKTYKYYIDFAAANKLEYIIIDDGWSSRLDLFKLNEDLNLPEVLAYAKDKNVGVILWASWFAFRQDMEKVCKTYSEMGVKGFKVDFFDRDDQEVLSSVYKMSEIAAKYQLVMDYHGFFKPQGIQRTYPNVLNFEGVKGLENVKWTPNDNVPRYDVSIPFIRQVAGPMDYTPGAMRNRNRWNFRPSHSMPVSQGTRAHQVAMYVLFEAPLQMLADSPTAYMKEQETTDFIAQIPTVFVETVPLAGSVAAFAAVARKKGDVWYLGALNNWKPRVLHLDLSFLGEGSFTAEIFKDGVNANRNAEDYKIETVNVNKDSKLEASLAGGGGWTAIIKRTK